jgi:hypothetical protein
LLFGGLAAAAQLQNRQNSASGRRKQPAALLSFAMTGRVEISRDSRLPRRARRCIAKRAQAFDQLINLIIEKAYSALAQRDGA